MQVVVQLCCLRRVGAVHFVQLFDAGLVHDGGVGQNGDDDVIFGQLIVLGKLDAAKNVRDAGNAHPGELFDLLVGKTEALEVLLTFLAVKQAQQALGVFVVNVDDHVGVLDIVDPGDVLVADAFDAVATEAVIQNGRALERFADGELHAGITFFQKVACGHRAGGAGGEAGASESLAGLLGVFKEVRQRVAGDIVVPQGVAHLGELVEDHHGRILLEFPGLVEDFLDVTFAARGRDDLAGDGLEPVEALLGHILRQDGDGVAGKKLGVESAAAAVVTGGGPDRVMIRCVKLAGHESRSQAAEGSANLVAAGREPLAGHGKNAAGNTGHGGRNFDVVRGLLVKAAGFLCLVVPVDAEEVHGVNVPQTGVRQLFLDLFRNQIGVLHLRDGRDDDIVFLCLLDVVCQTFFVDGQINRLVHVVSPPVLLLSK